MSSSVDSRIVTMKFDNTQFEKGVKTSMGTMSKLKAMISGLPSSSKNLDSIANSASRFNLGAVKTQIEGVNAKFLAMSSIAVTALSTITSKAIETGTSLVRGMVEPMRAGLAEYETNLNSIQTILANTQAS